MIYSYINAPVVAYTDHGDYTVAGAGPTFDVSLSTTRRYALLCCGAFDVSPGTAISSVVRDPSGAAEAFSSLFEFTADVGGATVLGGFFLLDKVLSSDTVRFTFSASLATGSFCLTTLSMDNLLLTTARDTDSQSGSDAAHTLSALDAAPRSGLALAASFADNATAHTWSGATGTELSDFASNNTFNRFSVWASDLGYDGANITATGGSGERATGGVILR